MANSLAAKVLLDDIIENISDLSENKNWAKIKVESNYNLTFPFYHNCRLDQSVDGFYLWKITQMQSRQPTRNDRIYNKKDFFWFFCTIKYIRNIVLWFISVY